MNAPAKPEATQTHIAYIGLGSNIEPEGNLPRAVILLRERCEVEALSSVWRSPAVGGSGPDFLNAAAKLRTPLARAELKQVLRAIEKDLGRVRGEDPNAPRPIDLDILLFDDVLHDQALWRHAHLALPMSELYPGFVDPDGLSLADCAAQLLAQVKIARVSNILPE